MRLKGYSVHVSPVYTISVSQNFLHGLGTASVLLIKLNHFTDAGGIFQMAMRNPDDAKTFMTRYHTTSTADALLFATIGTTSVFDFL